MLKDKYQDLLKLGEKLQVSGGDWKEEGGKLILTGTAKYQLDKDLLFDKIKGYANWENEVKADIKVGSTDIYGVYTVEKGDTLSKIAKKYLGDANSYMKIFDMNKDILKNPDQIQIGQNLKIPKK